MRGQNAKTTERARLLRQSDNEAEAVMWEHLRAHRLNGHKFVRQLPIGPYFADFACRASKLVIELDGSQHLRSTHDEKRDRFMASNGWSIARFWTADFLRNQKDCLETIVAVLDGRIHDRAVSADFKFIPTRSKA